MSNKRVPIMGFLLVGAFFLAVVILGNVLTVGDKLARVHPAIAWLFYGISVSLFTVICLAPIAKVLALPADRIGVYMVEKPDVSTRRLHATVKRLQKDQRVSSEKKQDLQAAKDTPEQQIALVREIYMDRIVLIEDEIERTSGLVFMASAISQNGILDAIAVVYYNVRMLKNITMMSGFRPGIRQLLKMYGEIFTAAFIFNTIEEIEPEALLEDLLDSSGEKLFTKLLSKLSGSLIQGMLSAYVTGKIGYVTRYWLYMTEEQFSEAEIKKMSRNASRKILLRTIKKGAGAMPTQMTSMAGKWFSKNGRKNSKNPAEPVSEVELDLEE